VNVTTIKAAASERSRFDLRLLLALATVYVVWGSTYLAMRVTVQSLPPWGQAGFRFVCAGAVLLAIARARGEPWPTQRAWLISLPIGALLFAMGNGLVAAAERTVSSGLAAVVCATTPLFAAGFGVVRGERPDRAEAFGMLLGVTGVIVLGLGSPLASAGIEGVMIVVAPIGFAIGSLWARAESRRSGGGVAGTAAHMLMGGIVLLVISATLGERVPEEVPFEGLFAWGYLVIFGSLVGFTTYAWLLRNARPTVAMSYAYVNPLVALLLGAALLEEQLSGATAFGGLFIATGVMMALSQSGPTKS
jgi:drug/metabolite transporter (DMT)-like permease